MIRFVPLALLLGCADVAQEMQDGLRRSNDAVAFGLLAGEAVAWVDSPFVREPGEGTSSVSPKAPPGARHNPAGTCPKLTREPLEGDPFVLTATYAEFGCPPDSGLVPTSLGGTLTLEGRSDSFSSDLTTLVLGNARPAGGVLEATDLGDGFYQVTGTLDLEETPLLSAIRGTLDLEVSPGDADAVTLDGTIEVDDGDGPVPVSLRGVLLSLGDIPGDCPRPRTGTAVVKQAPDVEVRYAVGGEVDLATAKRKGRTSDPSRLCAFPSDVL